MIGDRTKRVELKPRKGSLISEFESEEIEQNSILSNGASWTISWALKIIKVGQ